MGNKGTVSKKRIVCLTNVQMRRLISPLLLLDRLIRPLPLLLMLLSLFSVPQGKYDPSGT